MLHIMPEAFVLKPSFAKIVCEPTWKWQRRDKPLGNYDLFYVWSGEGEVTINDQAIDVSRGSCFLFRPGDYTSATHNPQKPLLLTYIHFQLRESISLDSLLVPLSYRLLAEPMELEKLLARYVRIFLVENFGAEEEARLILQQMMIQLLREDQRKKAEAQEGSNQLTEVIHEVANYIRLHAGFAHRVEQLAERASLSPRYFAALFKQKLGCSVQAFVIRSRIERAEHLLRYAGMTVSEVADMLGYRDVFFFSRQFKRYTGNSPSKLR